MPDVTRLLDAAVRGDAHAVGQLFPLVYDELRRLARARMAGERAEHTLQPTALVHEVYLRLIEDVGQQFGGRGHFFAAAAEAMRRILVEHARGRRAAKRGGGRCRVQLPEDLSPAGIGLGPDELLALDEALEKLARVDPQKADLVKLLYFAGLNLDGAARAQGIGRSTAHRHWLSAREWLRHELEDGAP